MDYERSTSWRWNPQPLPPDANIKLVALNPQPLPPDATIELVALNPQPLPPQATINLAASTPNHATPSTNQAGGPEPTAAAAQDNGRLRGAQSATAAAE